MKAKFYLDGGQPKVEIDNEWNALSLFLESDSSFEDVVRHLELKKQRRWMGNTSVIRHISGSKYQVSTELDVNIKSVELSQSQLLRLIEAWHDFNNNRIDCIVSV